jgi:predicted transcriptional regulator of viral defense system
MQITDYQPRIVWLMCANDPQKAAYQITQYHVRMMLTATVATEASVVYCTDTCVTILSGLKSYIWPAAWHFDTGF